MLKNIFVLVVLIGFCVAFSCQTTKNPSPYYNEDATNNDTIKIQNDSLSYKLIIIEPGFNGWLATQRPRGFYEQSFLEVRNIHYVNAYNTRVLDRRNTKDRELYPFLIDYQAGIDYGYEVNYMLYHYFIYFEKKYNQNLRN